MKFITLVILGTFLLSCGSSYNVVHEGSAYQVKGSKIYKSGVEVTETISEDTKMHINSKLDERLAQEAEAKRIQKDLEAKQKEQEKLQKEAAKKQAEFEAEQAKIEQQLKAKNNARKAFVRAGDKLRKEQNKYSRLLKKGSLSPNDIDKWEMKIKKLTAEKDKAEAYYKSL